MKTTRALSFVPTTSLLNPVRLVALAALFALLAALAAPGLAPRFAFADEFAASADGSFAVQTTKSVEAVETAMAAKAASEPVSSGATAVDTSDQCAFEDSQLEGESLYPITLINGPGGIAGLNRTKAAPGDCIMIRTFNHAGFDSFMQDVILSTQNASVKWAGGRNGWCFYEFCMPAEPVTVRIVYASKKPSPEELAERIRSLEEQRIDNTKDTNAVSAERIPVASVPVASAAVDARLPAASASNVRVPAASVPVVHEVSCAQVGNAPAAVAVEP